MVATAALELDQARRLVLARAAPAPSEQVSLDLAAGRVLAEEIVAREPVPGFDGSAMDGFAVRHLDVDAAARESPVRLRVIGESRAGRPAHVALAAGEAVAISTGAALPRGADAVIRVEDTRREAGIVEVYAAAASGHDIRRAGEDMLAGEVVMGPGAALDAAALGVLAAIGRSSVACRRRPRVSLLCSGDELLAPDEQMRPGGIRDSNGPALAALVGEAGGEVVSRARVRDDARATVEALEQALQDVDIAVICGGVSVGEHDHVKAGLSSAGVEQVFWRLALKPGGPAWFGRRGRTLVFGLPGNPVSAMVVFTLLVGPALRAMLGRDPLPTAISATLDVDYGKPPGRAHALRCRLTLAGDGWHARPTGPQGSHLLTSMLATDGLAIIPSGSTITGSPALAPLEPVRALPGSPS